MEHFDLVAKDFDTDTRVARAKIIADKIREHIDNGSTKSAMEYGCGTGLVGLHLSDMFMALCLVDSSSEMIAQVEHKLKKQDNPSVSALCADFMETTPRGLHFDYIFTSLALHHIIDTEGILRRLYDILNKEGHLLIVDLNADDGSFHAKHPIFDGHNGFEQSSLIDLAVKAGFAHASAETFFHSHKAVNGKDKPYSLFILDATK